MSMSVCVVIKKHNELSEKQFNDIARLKDQHWPHGVESQKAWITKNFGEDDIHIILYLQDSPVAYASLNDIQCTIYSREETVFGLGGVCVAKSCQKQGLGKQIVECANRYIATAEKPGLLLCHKELTGFYSLCGWEVINCEEVTVAGMPFAHLVMSFEKEYSKVDKLVISKNF